MLNYFVTALRSSWHYYYERIKIYQVTKISDKTFKTLSKALDSRIGEQLDVFALVGPLEVPDIREQLKQIYLHDSELANFVKGTFAVLLENQR